MSDGSAVLPEVVLPDPPAAMGDYLPALARGGLVHTAGMTPRSGAGLVTGRLGAEVDLGSGRAAAGLAALRALAAAAAAVGGLQRIEQVVNLVVYAAAADGFTDFSAVADGASAALRAALGDSAGRGARTACGVAALPGGACVEVSVVAAYRV